MVIGWLARLLVGLAVSALILYEFGAIAFNHVTLDGTANDIAREVASSLPQHNATAPASLTRVALPLAATPAREARARVVAISLDDRGVLHVRLRRPARTLLVRRIDALRKYGRADVTGTATTP
jgi:hypothetical protein